MCSGLHRAWGIRAREDSSSCNEDAPQRRRGGPWPTSSARWTPGTLNGARASGGTAKRISALLIRCADQGGRCPGDLPLVVEDAPAQRVACGAAGGGAAAPRAPHADDWPVRRVTSNIRYRVVVLHGLPAASVRGFDLRRIVHADFVLDLRRDLVAADGGTDGVVGMPSAPHAGRRCSLTSRSARRPSRPPARRARHSSCC
jgi:hypothetical protein